MSVLFSPLWFQVGLFFACGMRLPFSSHSEVFIRVNWATWKRFYTISCETTLNFRLQLAKKRMMSKIISARKDSRVWTKSFLAGNSFFGPYQGDVTQLIKRVQFPLTPSVQFKVSANAFLVNLATCFITL